MSFTLGLKCPHDQEGNCTCKTIGLGKLSIWTASEYGLIEAVSQALSVHPGLAQKCDTYGYTALHYAAQRNHCHVMDLLLRHHADVNANQCGATPLHRAASFKSYHACELLLSRGANVNAVDTSFGDCRTPLMKAACAGSKEILLLLLRYHADQHGRDSAGKCAWDLACDANIHCEELEVPSTAATAFEQPSLQLPPCSPSFDFSNVHQNGIVVPSVAVPTSSCLSCSLCGLPTLFLQRHPTVKNALVCSSCRVSLPVL